MVVTLKIETTEYGNGHHVLERVLGKELNKASEFLLLF